ncbi:hypothetical protein EJ04DRAFT_507384 [Polyplosphaeria fusca]|uniref:Uncharacterized protein n=1 Tax=Polyplosphaeria fusca TaxID=682080 RepID=A0A9P4R8G8_9PLEO|nr:hypothetical protein EJ04DRAFT_507384 [Polyplosphaeria fusca]
MPVQHTICGQPVRLQVPPRRFQLLLAFIFAVITTLTLFGPPSSADIPTYEEAKEFVKNPQLPSMPDLPMLGPGAHKPATPTNSSASSLYGPIQWLSDFKWRNPFSNSITLDENTALLPPFDARPPIYTFYDVRSKQDKALSEAENRLILTWRRAWWAQGFRPQVLSRAEAMKHPQYQMVQRLKLESIVELEIMRWLAWGHMGGGILANWLALPMATYDNPMLSFLRRNEYPNLSRVDTLSNAVFFGGAADVNTAITKVIDHPLFKNVTENKDKIAEMGSKPGGTVVNMLSEDDIAVDAKANGIAYYSKDTLSKSYKTLSEKLTGNTTQVVGLDMLAGLINSHLHLTFQETFGEGIAVVKPLPEHTTALLYEAIDIARNLTQCPPSPAPKSCPPNRLECTPCDHSKPPKLQLVPSYRNSSALYNIGTVPHPYTLNLLHYTRDTLDENFLRRNAARNLWLDAVTKDVLDKDHTNEQRVIAFKEIVATPNQASNSLWLTAERVSQADLDWIFGFTLPQVSSKPDDKSDLTYFPRPAMPQPLEGVQIPEEKWIKNEEERLQKARNALQSEDRRMKDIIDMVEKWNLGDTEIWKFSRAWSARRRVERKKWEEEEHRYAGAESKAGLHTGGGAGGRWTDKLKS